MVSSSTLFHQKASDHSNPRQTAGVPLQRPMPVQSALKGSPITSQQKLSVGSSQKLITVVRVKHPLEDEALMPIAWMWPITNISGKVMDSTTALRVMSDFLGEGGVQNVLLSRGKSDKKDDEADDHSSEKDAEDGGDGYGGNSGNQSPSNLTYVSSADSDDTPPGGCFDFPLCNVLDFEIEEHNTDSLFEASIHALPDDYQNTSFDNCQISIDENLGWNSVSSDRCQTLDFTPTNSFVPDWIEFTKKHALIQEEAVFHMKENVPFLTNMHRYCSNLSPSSKSLASPILDPDFSTATDLRSSESKLGDSGAHYHSFATNNAFVGKPVSSVWHSMSYESDSESYEPTSLESLIGELTLTVREYDHQGTIPAASHHSLYFSPTLDSIKDQSSIHSCTIPDISSLVQPMGKYQESDCHSYAGRTKYPTSQDTSTLSPQVLHGCDQVSHSYLLMSPLTPASFQAPEKIHRSSCAESTSSPTRIDELQQYATESANRMQPVEGGEFTLLGCLPEASPSTISTKRNSTSAWANDPKLSSILQGLSCGKTFPERERSKPTADKAASTSLGEPCDALGRQIFGRIENSGVEIKPPIVQDTSNFHPVLSKGPSGYTIQVLSSSFPSECRVYETSGLVRPTENDRPAIICHGRSIVDWVQRCVSSTSTINVWFSTLDVFMDGYAKTDVLDLFIHYPGTSFGSSFAGEHSPNHSFEVFSM